MYKILCGNAIDMLKTLPSESVQTCVTSPPYFRLRDYGINGQIGLEETLEKYICKLTEVFREVRRVLCSDGTLWLNLADTYANSGRNSGTDKINYKQSTNTASWGISNKVSGFKPKDLAGSKKGDTVLDPFCGSGTTGAVAVKCNRKFIGIDLNPEYCNLSESRIKQSEESKNTTF